MSALDDYYAQLFRIDRRDLWHRVTARTHGRLLDGYEGHYIAWRGDGAHASVPPSVDAAVQRSIESESVETLQAPEFWEEFAEARALRVIGPSTHAYLDVDPGPVEGVVPVNEAALASLRLLVDAADWTESGWDDEPAHTFGVYEQGELVAASNLNSFLQQPRDIGVIVAPACRGRGLAQSVGRHAAGFAVRTTGFARWGAQHSNVASVAAARKLGFEPWCHQLGVR